MYAPYLVLGHAMLLLLTAACTADAAPAPSWPERLLDPRGRDQTRWTLPADAIRLQDFGHGWGDIERQRSVIRTPLNPGGHPAARGLGLHAPGRLRVHADVGIARFTATVAIDRNDRTIGSPASAAFRVSGPEGVMYESPVMRVDNPAIDIDVPCNGAPWIDLILTDGGDGYVCDHADWANARITTSDGSRVWLDELPLQGMPPVAVRFPFGFLYDGVASDHLLPAWKRTTWQLRRDAHRTVTRTEWTDPRTGLRVAWDVTCYPQYRILDWILTFENTGQSDTPIISNVQPLSLVLHDPADGVAPYTLYRTNGAPSDPSDFEPTVQPLRPGDAVRFATSGGRSSNSELPFFKVDTGSGAWIFAIGWSGQWAAQAGCDADHRLGLAAGMELTHFRLYPGERVRTPRIACLYHPGDTWDANARFRAWIYEHVAARRDGARLLPTPFCNTCFTRGGGWLNKCTADNQISLIKAYAPLGLEALITDAGWFEGGWPMGAGNWTPRRDAYPDGMAPIGRAALDHGMIYGLWFEPERVMAGTAFHREHPDWVLWTGDTRGMEGQTGLANFGLPEVRAYFMDVVRAQLSLPGVRFYRQDFNMDPLPYWRQNDAEDRQGITEIRYIEGLYAWWDAIAAEWPDGLREECASGGRRIDLETVTRMHLHQESDYWFDNDIDQAQIWGLSQYLPNSTFTTPIIRLDDYTFHSTLATSIIPGWIADDPAFDTARAGRLMDRWRSLRPYLIGAWYPALPYTRQADAWGAQQFHREDLDAGMLLVFRHANATDGERIIALRGLKAADTYRVRSDRTGPLGRYTGRQLMQGLPITLPAGPASDVVEYTPVR